tara:strand:- start:4477 stop:6417 length:1941 start_codon:yes stop_codon:yes gene_type:complete
VKIVKKQPLTITQASDFKLLNYFTVVTFLILLTHCLIPKVFATPVTDLGDAIKSINKLSPEVDNNCKNLKEKNPKTRSDFSNNLFVIARLGLPGYEATVLKKVNRSRVDFHTISKHYIRNESDERISFLELSKDKMDIIFDLYGYDKNEKEDAHIISELLQAKTEEEILQILGARSEAMDEERKLKLLASIGHNLSLGYDLERAKAIPDKAVTTMEMVTALRASVNNFGPRYNGVCRDIHQTIGKMANAMGLKNVHGVGFRTKFGPHLTATISNSKGRLDHIDYDDIHTNTQIHGVGALELNSGEDTTSFGLANYIYNPKNDRSLLVLPSRFHLSLMEASKGETEDLMYGYRQNPSGFKIGKSFGNHGTHLALQEYGRGTKGITLGAFYTYKNKNKLPLNVDSSVGVYQSSRKLYENKTTNDYGIYSRIKGTKKYQLKPEASEGLNGKIELSSNIQFSTECRKINGEKKFNECSNFSSGIGAAPISYQGAGDITGEISYKSGKDFIKGGAKTKIHLNTMNARSAKRDTYRLFLGQKSLYLDSKLVLGILKLETKNDITSTPTLNGSVYTYFLSAKLSDLADEQSLSLSKSGLLSKDAPSWVPGSEKIERYQIKRKLIDGLRLGAEFERNLDYPQYSTGFINFSLRP